MLFFYHWNLTNSSLQQSLDAATSTRGKIGAKLLGQEADTTLLARQVQLLESMTFEERLT